MQLIDLTSITGTTVTTAATTSITVIKTTSIYAPHFYKNNHRPVPVRVVQLSDTVSRQSETAQPGSHRSPAVPLRLLQVQRHTTGKPQEACREVASRRHLY